MAEQPDFDAFFMANYDGLVRSLTAVTGSREMAQDAVQEAFIKAYARWKRLADYDDPVLWVRRVAINKSRDLARSGARRRRREDRFDSLDSRSDDGFGVEGQMSLMDALGRLSPRQRTVAALFYIDDMSVADIAAATKLTQGAVKFHLNKARNALRVILADEGALDD